MPVNLSHVDINKIKNVVDQEFDTEILLKNNDLNAIENEIGKAEAQLTMLKKYYEEKDSEKSSETSKKTRRKSNSSSKAGHKRQRSSSPEEEPTQFSKKYTQLLSILNGSNATNGSSSNSKSSLDSKTIGEEPKKRKSETIYSPVSSGYMTTRSQSSSLRPVARMRPSANSVEFRYQQQNKCICRRSDNVLISLACPKCGKTDFLSPQGFINHCRIAHMIDILSHDHAAMTCGTLLPNEEQDDKGLEALENLEKHGLDPNVNLNKPDLEEYAKTNKSDPLAGMDSWKDVKKERDIEKMETEKTEKTEKIEKSEKSEKKEKRKPLKYGHLKTFLGDSVKGFEKLVNDATEEAPELGDSDGE